MIPLNILASVKRIDDMPSNPLVCDFVFIENLDIGMTYTSKGWEIFTASLPNAFIFFHFIVLQ